MTLASTNVPCGRFCVWLCVHVVKTIGGTARPSIYDDRDVLYERCKLETPRQTRAGGCVVPRGRGLPQQEETERTAHWSSSFSIRIPNPLLALVLEFINMVVESCV